MNNHRVGPYAGWRYIHEMEQENEYETHGFNRALAEFEDMYGRKVLDDFNEHLARGGRNHLVRNGDRLIDPATGAIVASDVGYDERAARLSDELDMARSVVVQAWRGTTTKLYVGSKSELKLRSHRNDLFDIEIVADRQLPVSLPAINIEYGRLRDRDFLYMCWEDWTAKFTESMPPELEKFEGERATCTAEFIGGTGSDGKPPHEWKYEGEVLIGYVERGERGRAIARNGPSHIVNKISLILMGGGGRCD